MKSQLLKIAALAVFLLSNAYSAVAQCPMCKANVEANLEMGGTRGVGLNDAILYLLVVPYIAVMVIGFLWYRSYKANKRREQRIIFS